MKMLPKVYYNDECAICKLEINHYKKICDSINWQGIHKINDLKQEINKTPAQIIRRLHVKKDDNILIGVDAFIFIWSKIPRYKSLSKIVKLPLIYFMAKILYEFLSIILYLKNYHQVKRLTKKNSVK